MSTFQFSDLARDKGPNNKKGKKSEVNPTVVPILSLPKTEPKKSNLSLMVELSTLLGPETEWHGKEKKVYELASKVSYHVDQMQELFSAIKNNEAEETKKWALIVLNEASYNPMSYESYELFKKILIYLMNEYPQKTSAALEMASRKMNNEFGVPIIEDEFFLRSLQNLVKVWPGLRAAQELFAYHTGAAYIG
ncbi:MAG: hypothetical protein AB1468_03700 [Candidatus Micrarchaeota archaeon]